MNGHLKSYLIFFLISQHAYTVSFNLFYANELMMYNLFYSMRHVAAYILAVMGGKKNPTVADLVSILSSVGIEADTNSLSFVIEKLKGQNVFEVIENGKVLLADMPTGGGGGISASAPVSVAVGGVEAPVEEVKEEKKPIDEDSDSDSDMGMGLFDD